MKKSTYSRCSQIVSTVTKSTAIMLCACAAQECAPGESRALAGGSGAGLSEELAHRGGGDGEAEAAELAGNPLVPQHGFSRARHKPRSRISFRIGGRPSRAVYVQRFATSRRCQRSSVVGVTRNERQLACGSSRLAAARKTRSAGLSSGGPTWRRSTASSWRRTTISSSLNPSERRRSAELPNASKYEVAERPEQEQAPPETAGRAHESTGEAGPTDVGPS